MKVSNKVIYLTLVIFSMLLSFGVKRAAPVGRNVVKSTLGRRSFSFSSSWSSGHHGPKSGAASSAANFDSGISSFIHYNVAVAYQPKDREEQNIFRKKKKTSAASQSPTGEDNLFVSKECKDGYIAVGVADGVGGWSEAGYDSSAISRELCASIRTHFETADSYDNISAKDLLTKGVNEIMNSPKVEIGGTTACFGILTPDKKLKVANLGDSWCGLFRGFKLVKETNFQTHNFNTPYQIAKIPRQIVRQAELEGRRYIIDTPDKADEYEWDLQKDDIIMFATDGVTDNIIPADMEIFLKDKIEQENLELGEIATKFVKEVVKVSRDPNFPSAFAQELSRLTGQKYLGGKEDDITVVLVKVT